MDDHFFTSGGFVSASLCATSNFVGIRESIHRRPWRRLLLLLMVLSASAAVCMSSQREASQVLEVVAPCGDVQISAVVSRAGKTR